MSKPVIDLGHQQFVSAMRGRQRYYRLKGVSVDLRPLFKTVFGPIENARPASRRGASRSSGKRDAGTKWGEHRRDLPVRQYAINYHHETDDRWDMPRTDYVRARSKRDARAAFWRHHKGKFTIEEVMPHNTRLKPGAGYE